MTTALAQDPLNPLSQAIIGAAIDVHSTFGPGLFENVFLACLCQELRLRGVGFETQRPIPVVYKNIALDCAYRADLLVEDQVLVEVKALESLAGIHTRQLLTYLRLSNRRLGLLLNFGAPTMKEGIRRVLNGYPEPEARIESVPRAMSCPLHGATLAASGVAAALLGSIGLNRPGIR
jgi:GxxExxY protein